MGINFYPNLYSTNSQFNYAAIPNAISNSNKIPQKLADDNTIFGANGCTDGKNDGKISLGEKIKNVCKGVFNTVIDAVTGIFTDPKKMLLTTGIFTAISICPPLGVALAAVGGIMGAVTVGKGIHKASQAKTDGETKQAWQEIGSGGFQVGLSVIGGKAALKNCTNTSAALADQSVPLATRLENAGKGLLQDAKFKTIITKMKTGGQTSQTNKFMRRMAKTQKTQTTINPPTSMTQAGQEALKAQTKIINGYDTSIITKKQLFKTLIKNPSRFSHVIPLVNQVDNSNNSENARNMLFKYVMPAIQS